MTIGIGSEIVASTSRGTGRPWWGRPHNDGTYLCLRKLSRGRDRYCLSINVHPRDVQALKMEPKTMWKLVRATQTCGGNEGDRPQNAEQVLVLVKNMDHCRNSPQVKITTTLWGQWNHIVTKEAVETQILMGCVQKLVIPVVEVDTTSDGSPVLVIRLPRHQGSEDAANEVCECDVVHEVDNSLHVDQQESEVEVALEEDNVGLSESLNADSTQSEVRPPHDDLVVNSSAETTQPTASNTLAASRPIQIVVPSAISDESTTVNQEAVQVTEGTRQS